VDYSNSRAAATRVRSAGRTFFRGEWGLRSNITANSYGTDRVSECEYNRHATALPMEELRAALQTTSDCLRGQNYRGNPAAWEAPWEFVPLVEAFANEIYWELRITTTSLVWEPRASESRLPSFDQAKLKIWPVLKSVTCLGGPPSTG
jgi:hypothetical protein